MTRIIPIALHIIRSLLVVIAFAFASSANASNHFAWGADVGTSIDLSGHDMSTINFDAHFGYKNSIIDIAGVGAGVHMMVSNSCRSFPVYAVLRTSFRAQPSLCFLDLRAGVAFDSMSDDSNQTRPYINPGVGFNLATGRTFKSYIIIGYLYNGMKSFGDTAISGGLNMANFRIGITF